MSKKIILSHIVAAGENNVIGFKGELPWDIPEDLKYFFNKTKHKILIMGRKSFDSLGKPLPNRLNIVLTRQKSFQDKYNQSSQQQTEINTTSAIQDKTSQDKNPIVFPNFEEALKYAVQPAQIEKYGNEIFIGGGGEIYKQTLLSMDRLYVTRIYKSYQGDAFYPEIPKDKFKLVSQSDRKEPVPFSFLVYEKIK